MPEEFQIQNPDFANPPTLLFALTHFAKTESEKNHRFLAKLFPKLQLNYEWFHKTQSGVLEHGFRWRGRTENHTLCSGLDDYPRLLIPSDNELHLDLISWMAFYSRALKEIANLLGLEKEAQMYHSKYKIYSEKILTDYWSEEHQIFCDFVSFFFFELRSL